MPQEIKYIYITVDTHTHTHAHFLLTKNDLCAGSDADTMIQHPAELLLGQCEGSTRPPSSLQLVLYHQRRGTFSLKCVKLRLPHRSVSKLTILAASK